jgi:ATP-binding cassette subfamily F protein uup
VLVLDEPTNDLDIETLELLEERLMQYSGTLLLVSHDREFLNNVVTSTLVLEGGGHVKEYAGGYDDWLRQRKLEPQEEPSQKIPEPKTAVARRPTQKTNRLTYAEKRELETLPEKIETLESKLAALHDKMSEPTFYQQDRDAIVQTNEQLQSLQAELAEAYTRWEQLDARQR